MYKYKMRTFTCETAKIVCGDLIVVFVGGVSISIVACLLSLLLLLFVLLLV
jgi:hypothetical protein